MMDKLNKAKSVAKLRSKYYDEAGDNVPAATREKYADRRMDEEVGNSWRIIVELPGESMVAPPSEEKDEIACMLAKVAEQLGEYGEAATDVRETEQSHHELLEQIKKLLVS